MTLDPLGDDKSRIQLLEHLGGDLAIVNDARASFEKESTELGDKDRKLIHYLIAHEHTSPFRGTVFKFKVKAPLYICRQWWKHVVSSNSTEGQLGWNERSFRYVAVEDDADFYCPRQLRGQSSSNRQASDGYLPEDQNAWAIALYSKQCESSYETYQALLKMGVSREQARGVLVPSFYTTWVWTASLQAVLHFIDLRRGAGAQSEIGAYARAVQSLILPLVPVAIEAWAVHRTGYRVDIPGVV